MKPFLSTLPISEHLPTIAKGVREHTLSILQAPPGSGKTTILPLYLLEEEWLKNRRIIMLQPRRLAAKSVANRMSELCSEAVGNTIGYQIRLERKTSPTTRIEIITEGLLTRKILAEPDLSDVGLIIFDEFHERSLNADTALSLSLEIASVLRSDLRLLIMSATLESVEGIPLLAQAWRYSFGQRPYPVEIHYTPQEPRKTIWENVARSIETATQKYDGDLLAFLPGAYEIQRCAEILRQTLTSFAVLPLYGDLPYEQQRLAVAPSTNAQRKVILSTPIAETSLTIDGVRIVVDSGLQKIARSNESHSSLLRTERITKDAAEQRAGRAGRTAPGVCIRLWSEQEHATLRPHREPEALRTDLSQTALELAAWGIRDPHEFSWLSRPPVKALNTALELLQRLNAVSKDGIITATGHKLVRLGAHPRMGACCLTARRHSLDLHAATLLALLEERPPPSKTRLTTDITQIAETLLLDSPKDPTLRRIQQVQKLWLTRIKNIKHSEPPLQDRVQPELAWGFLLASAFPDRIARRRSDSRERYLLASGSGATLPVGDPLSDSEFIVIAELHQHAEDNHIVRAAPLTAELFDSHLRHLVREETHSYFDATTGVLASQKNVQLGAITIKSSRLSKPSVMELHQGLIEFLRTQEGFSRLPFSESAQNLQARCAWARTTYQLVTIPDLSPEALRHSDPFWLEGRLPESGKLADITATIVESALNDAIDWHAKARIEEMAPKTITLPSGKSKPISYCPVSGPTLEATIQELFGLADTPTIGPSKRPLTLKLLSPARRPMQVTQDLANFWKHGYAEVRKELRGRYPKHKWPEDPRKPS